MRIRRSAAASGSAHASSHASSRDSACDSACDGAHDGGRGLAVAAGPTPTLHAKIDSAAVTDREVARGAGAGRIP